MAIDIVSETGDLEQRVVLPQGARQLGIRVKPIVRLGMGFKDPDRGFPVKTDYFTVRGDDRAVAKFYAEYGEKPKAVEILLPSELDVALTIQYRAFKGAAGGEGGTLVAVGHTNFASRDYCGGADTLTVFNIDGTVEEVETAGLDANTRQPLDDVAKELGLELYTTFRAGMPKVLGFGSYFDISTKGKESTDNLWAKLRELYALFGARVSFAMKPQLVLRQSTARPVVIDKETKKSKRTTTTIYALDIVVPETIDEMIGRLQDRAALLPGTPAAALYGPRAIEGSGSRSPTDATPNDGSARTAQQAEDGGSPLTPSSVPEPEAEAAEEGVWEEATETPTVSEATITAAATELVPGGVHQGKTLTQVAKADNGKQWLFTQLKRLTPDDRMRPAIEVFVEHRVPDVWTAYETWLAEQNA